MIGFIDEPGTNVDLNLLSNGLFSSLFNESHCSVDIPKIKSLLLYVGVLTSANISPVLGFIATDALLSF